MLLSFGVCGFRLAFFVVSGARLLFDVCGGTGWSLGGLAMVIIC